MKIHLIGCGGVGSWLAPSLCLLRKPEDIVLIDGDKLEKKNMNRQLFSESDIGSNKAFALADRYSCDSMDEYYAAGLMEHDRTDWLFCCADNNPCRNAVLQSCDQYGCSAIIAANETTSSEAYYYRRSWREGPLDPRVYYPELGTDHSGDPRAEAIGCTGEAQEQNPQLVTSNAMAAALAAHLFVLWALKAPRLDRDTVGRLPYKFRANMTLLETFRIHETLEKGQK